mmetsp:Transcript_48495/g.126440  ORF Transcript_48495/g.126440 Transcript_48495/m.126440 type:complete len:206 (+) Transcript_48495:798-1415(+)
MASASSLAPASVTQLRKTMIGVSVCFSLSSATTAVTEMAAYASGNNPQSASRAGKEPSKANLMVAPIQRTTKTSSDKTRHAPTIPMPSISRRFTLPEVPFVASPSPSPSPAVAGAGGASAEPSAASGASDRAAPLPSEQRGPPSTSHWPSEAEAATNTTAPATSASSKAKRPRAGGRSAEARPASEGAIACGVAGSALPDPDLFP